jgi:hypothetical protein
MAPVERPTGVAPFHIGDRIPRPARNGDPIDGESQFWQDARKQIIAPPRRVKGAANAAERVISVKDMLNRSARLASTGS